MTRRLAAVTVSVVLGFLASIAVATTPAQAVPAVNAEVTSDAICDTGTGEWVVTWKVRNKDVSKDATLADVTPQVSPIVDGAVVGKGTTLTGYQRLASGTNSATLSLKVSWPPSGDLSTVSGSWSGSACTKSPTDCVNLTSTTSTQYFKHEFNGPAGTARIWRAGTAPLKPLCSPITLSLVSYYAPAPTFDLPQYVFDYKTMQFGGITYELNFKIDLPPCYTQVDFVQGERIDPLTDSSGFYNDRKIGSGTGWGHLSNGPSAWFNGNGTAGQTCTQPVATASPNCDGSGVLHLSNDGYYPTTFQVTKNGGSQTPVTVQPLSAADPALPFLTVAPGQWPVHVTGDHQFDANLTWSWPADCPPPTLTAEPDCNNVVLTVTNPAGNKALVTTATYGGQPAQSGTIAAGASKTFTFTIGTAETATITFADRPTWTLVAVYSPEGACGLANTGSSLTGVIAAGAGLLVVGIGLVFVVARQMGRRRRTT